MGVDKAFMQFGGQTLLHRALATMTAVCDKVTVVGDPAGFTNAAFAKYRTAKCGLAEDVSVVADIFPGCGPLAGIHAALAGSTAELNLMLAVDMPFVSAKLLAFLFAAAENNDAIITVPRTGNGLQPLCAVYRHGFSLVAEQSLQAGKYKVDAAFSGVSIRIIDEPELAAAGFSGHSFFNLNTPQDRRAAEDCSPQG